ncbi:MAG: 4-oxalocrotonate decarboxylase, partial [Rhodospirillaceae bacterium]|nr:4-oxalocrotonate decarboxylase [Rhodospirillaceae bacterium]
MTADINKLAKTVDDAARKAKAIQQLSETTPITVEEGYAVQAAAFSRRLARGETQVGMKMGFTSRAKMIQMGLSDMVWGRLSDQMLIEDGDEIDLKNYVHPRIEPELAFLLKRPLEGPVTAAQAMAAVEAVAPAMELIDSRYRNFKFSLADVV